MTWIGRMAGSSQTAVAASRQISHHGILLARRRRGRPERLKAPMREGEGGPMAPQMRFELQKPRIKRRLRYSSSIGAIEAARITAIARLNGRTARGSASKRLSAAPNSAQAPALGMVIAVNKPTISATLCA